MTEQDPQFSSKLRDIIKYIGEWADRAERNKLRTRDIEEMRRQRTDLERLISNREI